ncbi:DUF4956 domain-containing protein [Streptomyces sp. NPDC017979]|uniref:DUF4956 domain-containing protein n=1 Tax=unclassified Streptomyces TaxID=2593676 RepID=UPI0037BCB55C
MESLRQLAAHLGLDLIAVSLLTFAVYYPRHRRRDLLPAYLALNAALFTVVAALAQVGGNGGTALGFGLFGVLSIIRLRSDSIQHEEVAYYFTTLVIGLICGLPQLELREAGALTLLLLLVVYAADHPKLFARSRRTVVTLDAVYESADDLRADLGLRLGEPLNWTVMQVDYVRDLTVVDVRYRTAKPPAKATRRTTDAHSDESARTTGPERTEEPSLEAV